MAFPTELLATDGQPTGVIFRVMHPVHVLKSRVHNAMNLPGYDSPRRLKQLRVASLCIPAFASELLGLGGHEGNARSILQTVVKFSCLHKDALGLLAKHGVDPAAGARTMLDDERLNERFRQLEVPRLLRSLDERGSRRSSRSRNPFSR